MDSFFLPKLINDLVEFNPYSIGIFDTEGRIVMANQAMYILFGSLPKADYSFFSDPILINAGLSEKLEHLKTGNKITIENIWYNPALLGGHYPNKEICLKATVFPLKNELDEISHYVVMHEDITMIKHDEINIKKLSDIIEKSSDLIFVFDLDGEITYVNETVSKLFLSESPNQNQQKRKNIKEYLSKEIFHILNNQIIPETMISAHWSGDLPIVLNDNSVIETYANINAHKDEHGDVSYFSLLARDMTDINRITKKAELAKEKLFEDDKKASLGVFVSSMVEELLNPSTIILGFTEILAQELAKEKLDKVLAKNAIVRIQEALNRINAVSDFLVQKSKAEKSEYKLIDIHECINNILELHEETLKNDKIDIVLNLKATNNQVLAHSEDVSQIFSNLITNARDALTKAKERKLEISTENIGRLIKISISDTGIGIDKDLLKKVFDMFYTTKDNTKNSGLGLFFVNRIVKNLSGSISVDSEKGKWTKFVVTLNVS